MSRNYFTVRQGDMEKHGCMGLPVMVLKAQGNMMVIALIMVLLGRKLLTQSEIFAIRTV